MGNRFFCCCSPQGDEAQSLVRNEVPQTVGQGTRKHRSLYNSEYTAGDRSTGSSSQRSASKSAHKRRDSTSTSPLLQATQERTKKLASTGDSASKLHRTSQNLDAFDDLEKKMKKRNSSSWFGRISPKRNKNKKQAGEPVHNAAHATQPS